MGGRYRRTVRLCEGVRRGYARRTSVKIADFMKWLERPGRTPREITQRQKIRAILGMSVSR